MPVGRCSLTAQIPLSNYNRPWICLLLPPGWPRNRSVYGLNPRATVRLVTTIHPPGAISSLATAPRPGELRAESSTAMIASGCRIIAVKPMVFKKFGLNIRPVNGSTSPWSTRMVFYTLSTMGTRWILSPARPPKLHRMIMKNPICILAGRSPQRPAA